MSKEKESFYRRSLFLFLDKRKDWFKTCLSRSSLMNSSVMLRFGFEIWWMTINGTSWETRPCARDWLSKSMNSKSATRKTTHFTLFEMQAKISRVWSHDLLKRKDIGRKIFLDSTISENLKPRNLLMIRWILIRRVTLLSRI